MSEFSGKSFVLSGRDDDSGGLGPRDPQTSAGVESVSMGIRLYEEVEGLHAVWNHVRGAPPRRYMPRIVRISLFGQL